VHLAAGARHVAVVRVRVRVRVRARAKARARARARHLAAGARHVAVGLCDLEVLYPVLQVLRAAEAQHQRVPARAKGADETARTWLG
jgi:hypothetical protein